MPDTPLPTAWPDLPQPGDVLVDVPSSDVDLKLTATTQLVGPAYHDGMWLRAVLVADSSDRERVADDYADQLRNAGWQGDRREGRHDNGSYLSQILRSPDEEARAYLTAVPVHDSTVLVLEIASGIGR